MDYENKKGMFGLEFTGNVILTIIGAILIISVIVAVSFNEELGLLPFSHYSEEENDQDFTKYFENITNFEEILKARENVDLLIGFREREFFGDNDFIRYLWAKRDSYNGWIVWDDSGMERIASSENVDGDYRMSEVQQSKFVEGLKFITGEATQAVAINPLWWDAEEVIAEIVIKKDCRVGRKKMP